MSEACNTCGKADGLEVRLKKCSKCKFALYCSRDCQKAGWKEHKNICHRVKYYGPSPPQGLDCPIAKPFTNLTNGTWLHGRSEKDVYRLLIDAYRLRVNDNYTFDGEIDEDTLYGVYLDDSFDDRRILSGFRRFLGLATSRPGLLPSWWNARKEAECEALAMDQTQFHCLNFVLEKSDIIEYYNDCLFPMQLRMLAEFVLLRGPGGQSGEETRRRMMVLEEGNPNACVINRDDTTMTITILRPGT